MKTVFSIGLSFLLGAAFCLLLFFSGILDLTGSRTRYGPGTTEEGERVSLPVTETAHPTRKAPFPSEEPAAQVKKAESPPEQKTGTVMNAEEVASPPPVKEFGPEEEPPDLSKRGRLPESPPDVSSKEPPAPGEEDTHAKILHFLSESEPGAALAIEERLKNYLTGDLNLSEAEAEDYLRLSFWKNFVSLQRDWRTEDLPELRAAFMEEKALKWEGLRAKGLILMASEIEEAEASYRELVEKLSRGGNMREIK